MGGVEKGLDGGPPERVVWRSGRVRWRSPVSLSCPGPEGPEGSGDREGGRGLKPRNEGSVV